jgi:hypothetical protein
LSDRKKIQSPASRQSGAATRIEKNLLGMAKSLIRRFPSGINCGAPGCENYFK